MPHAFAFAFASSSNAFATTLVVVARL